MCTMFAAKRDKRVCNNTRMFHFSNAMLYMLVEKDLNEIVQHVTSGNSCLESESSVSMRFVYNLGSNSAPSTLNDLIVLNHESHVTPCMHSVFKSLST
jgi:hypothetical protein